MHAKNIDGTLKLVHEFKKAYPERELFAICLQGSQNYGLDIYTDEYKSDVDTKAIVIPSLEEIVLNKKPISTTHILPNNEHLDIKDIRLYFENFKKQNINFLEILFTDFAYVNAKYKEEWDYLITNRELIAHYNINQALRCMAGMSMEKKKAMCHPYPTLLDKIEKYGYDGKQLSHCVRLYEFIARFAEGTTVNAAYKSLNRKVLMNFKKQLDRDGFPLDKEDAVDICQEYCDRIRDLKDSLLEGRNYEVNTGVWIFLDEIKAKILKFKITKEVVREYKTSNLKDMMFYDGYFIYPDENFKKAEMAAIEKLKVQPQDNFFDYYKENENEKKS